MSLILLTEEDIGIQFRPFDADTWIIPQYSCFIIRVVDIIALVAELCSVGQDQETMGETAWYEELSFVRLGEYGTFPFPIGAGIGT